MNNFQATEGLPVLQRKHLPHHNKKFPLLSVFYFLHAYADPDSDPIQSGSETLVTVNSANLHVLKIMLTKSSKKTKPYDLLVEMLEEVVPQVTRASW
jgi:hypothetical protein